MTDDTRTTRPPIHPSGQSTLSTILNGMGNGGMIVGSAGFIANHASEFFGKAPLFKKDGMMLPAIVAVGSALGAVHGFYEAKDIQKFRNGVADRVNAMDQEAAIDRTKLQELYKQVQAHTSAHEKAR